jgi:thioredoxin 1
MKTILLLVTIVSLAMVLGCGKESEQQTAEKTAQDQEVPAEKVEVAAEPSGGEAADVESESSPVERAGGQAGKRDVTSAPGKPVEVGDGNFETEVLKSDMPVIVDFWAPWCGPCRIAGPVLESLAEEYKGKLKICKLNVDNSRQTAMKYGIRSIPTLIFFKNGKPVDQVIGVLPDYKAQLKSKIESYL